MLPYAVDRQAEALAARERDVAQQEASLQNDQEHLRQQQALLEESSQAVDKDRLEAREMLKVGLVLLTVLDDCAGSSSTFYELVWACFLCFFVSSQAVDKEHLKPKRCSR